ncbi:glycosyltransferase family 4 protein [Bacteroides acidifaciens]|uniref:glycosyltransferase family 4 protein n=1 Tax=Bacteroides acidifaciens TaxID=85831 RepID=UPI0025B02266|nr:glycosyltransferase family 4 protein [Bacteroides acidifaciens]
MTIVFVTVALNIHQAGVADELYRLTDGNYWFIETGDVGADNSKGGKLNDFSQRPYLIKTADGEPFVQRALQLVRDADVMIYGAAPLIYLRERIKIGKLTFMYSERWLKKGILNLLSPRLLKQQWFYHTYCHAKPFYALCSSAYAARDFRLMNSFIGKCYKWGYFTDVYEFDMKAILCKKKENSKVKILWVARLIDWKHPEVMIDLALRLLREKVVFNINMIGTGGMFNQLQTQIQKHGLGEYVHLLGSMSNEKVRQLMLSHHILCFTSDRNEGWGAVLNEGMGSGCCPVSSIEAGATPFLIKDGVNGFSFDLKKKNDLFEKVLWLINHPEERERMSIEAYKTIRNMWSPTNAANQLYKLCESMLNGKECVFREGPCSKS